MPKECLLQYESRRNSACLVQTPQGLAVRKTFREVGSFQRELEIYSLLQGKDVPCARVLRAEERTLLLTCLPGKNLVECLQQQEQTGCIQWTVWEKLAAWLTAFSRHTGLVMTDVNLRNFLYDEKTKTLYGLDFEECQTGTMLIPAATLAAYIRTYRPENTLLKQEKSQYVLDLFASSCGLDGEALKRESGWQEERLLQRRKK